MMRGIWTFSFLISITFSLAAQDQSGEIRKYPEKRLQLGWTMSKTLLHNIPEFDIVYRIKNRHAIGVSLEFLQGEYKTKNLHPENIEQGKGFRLFHKYYLLSSNNDNFLYLRHGVFIKKQKFSYEIEGFYEFQEDGSTFLRWENRTFHNLVTQTGYELTIGGEAIIDPFFIDLYLGIGFNKSNHDKKYQDIIFKEDVNDPRYSGPSFIGGLIIGFYLF